MENEVETVETCKTEEEQNDMPYEAKVVFGLENY